MKRKWKEERGETIIEALSAILIGALAVSLLFSAALSSWTMNAGTQDSDDVFRTSLENADARLASAVSTDTATVTVAYTAAANGSAAGGDKKLTVKLYGGRGALSYALPSPP